MKNCLLLLFLLLGPLVVAQQYDDNSTLEFYQLSGNILPHSPELYHLITGHPQGFLISYSIKTHGKEAWQSLYNFPDYGGYFTYQDFKNEILGKNYAVGIHYNFYFLNRKLMLKVAEGIAMTTHPYNKDNNSKNKAFGSKYMGNTNFVLNFKKEHLSGNFGLEAGLFFSHFSNGRFKSPNSGINTYGINLGVNYNVVSKQLFKPHDTLALTMKFTEPVKYNLIFRTGFNESPVVGSGQKPFYHIGFCADKRINRKSALQLGVDVFVTTSIKEYIKYRSVAYPDQNLDPDTDYKRVGVFIGHELFINKISIETQLGYYAYRPFKHDTPIYDRLGIKYYWNKNLYSSIAVKTHGFLAEATEFGVGVRL